MKPVGVGVPVYNGADHIVESLRSLKEQDFGDFEAHVLDNASTDDTADAVNDLISGDDRFQYHRNKETIPALENFKRVMTFSETPYFIWRADDDLSSSNCLSYLKRALDEAPDADVAVSSVRRLEFEIDRTTPTPELAGTTPAQRIAEILRAAHPTWFYGMWRRTSLERNLRMVGNKYPYLWAGDHLVTMPSMLRGAIVFAADALLIKRIFRAPAYRLLPHDRLKARALYKSMSQEFVSELNFSKQDLRVVEEALEFHYDARVAPLKKMKRAKLRNIVRRTFGLAPTYGEPLPLWFQ